MHRVIKDNLGFKSYVKRIAPKLTDTQKSKGYSFGIWTRKNIRKSTLQEKFYFRIRKGLILMVFITDKMTEYMLQVVKKLIIMMVSMVSQNILKVCVCYNDVTLPVIIEDGTRNHQRYIKKILPVALKDGREKNLHFSKMEHQRTRTNIHKSGAKIIFGRIRLISILSIIQSGMRCVRI